MLEYRPEECTNQSFKWAGSLFCSCGIPFANRYRNLPCYHIFCESCINREDSQNKCLMCDSQVEKVEDLHPNEEILICTVPKCNQGFLNFPSLKVHAKLSHSLTVDSPDDFYQKFGDVEVITHENVVTQKEKSSVKKTQQKRTKQEPPDEPECVDSTEPKISKSRKTQPKSDDKEDDFEILM